MAKWRKKPSRPGETAPTGYYHEPGLRLGVQGLPLTGSVAAPVLVCRAGRPGVALHLPKTLPSPRSFLTSRHGAAQLHLRHRHGAALQATQGLPETCRRFKGKGCRRPTGDSRAASAGDLLLLWDFDVWEEGEQDRVCPAASWVRRWLPLIRGSQLVLAL